MTALNPLNLLIVLLVLAIVAALVLTSGCTFATPFKGPGYERDVGVTLQGAGDTVIVVLTQAVLGDGDRGAFSKGTRRVMDSMDQHPGLIAWSVRREVFGDNAWTMTIWVDDESLNNFVYSQVHRDAVKRGMPAVSQTRFYSFELPADELPLSWDDALERLQEAESYGVAPGYRSD